MKHIVTLEWVDKFGEERAKILGVADTMSLAMVFVEKKLAQEHGLTDVEPELYMGRADKLMYQTDEADRVYMISEVDAIT